MSGVEIEYCEIMSQLGPSYIEKDLIEPEPNFDCPDVIASEIVRDIVENSLDIALQKEDNILKQHGMVGDIVDEFTPRSTKITDLSENPNTLLCPLEEEVKKELEKLNFPHSDSLPAKGVGDQLQESTEVLLKKKSFTLASKNFALEKKTRLTDLVKNSKSILSKLLSNETTRNKENEFEEQNEMFLKAIELDCVNPEDIRYKVPQSPEKIPLPKSNSEEILAMPDDRSMDSISLSKELDSCTRSYHTMDETAKKSMTLPSASCSKQLSGRKDLDKTNAYKVLNPKRWNVGTRIANYIRKHSSARKENTSEIKEE